MMKDVLCTPHKGGFIKVIRNSEKKYEIKSETFNSCYVLLFFLHRESVKLNFLLQILCSQLYLLI